MARPEAIPAALFAAVRNPCGEAGVPSVVVGPALAAPGQLSIQLRKFTAVDISGNHRCRYSAARTCPIAAREAKAEALGRDNV